MFNEIFVPILIVVFTGIITYVGRKIAQYLDAKLTESQMYMLREFAIEVIKQVEVQYENGAIKFRKASEYLIQKAKSIGINISEQDIKVIIESTLKTLKLQFGENFETKK